MSDTKEIFLLNVRLKEGDHNAFMEVYEKYNRGIYHFIKKFIQDTDTIDDIIHDAFLNLWKYRSNIKNNLSLQAYLYRISRNIIFKHLKEKIRSAEAILETSSDNQSFDNSPSADYSLESSEYDKIYELAIGQLPPQRKRIFLMSREEGLSYKEIADHLKISPNTVKEHMSLAMKTIREYIAKDHGIIYALLFLYTLGR
ncbi:MULTISPECIES: RNA polymerase sigma factor [Sphingobacterium]|jgi:RNA polymerase sigma-70 factor (ECF subfamily)|uniref:RNA polymerase sigma factor n=1 Tax=Sphingobacterium TaxID=28453 RepID=UPI00257F826A|nr:MULTISPECIES: RNA polymerase sigma-70 factor [Sphingobacterium]WET69838.1 MAG: RNA polymerase sigma-70 factor [Sphingobacterium sp.]